MRRRPAIVIVLAAAAPLLLSGCSALGLGGPPAPSATPSPSATLEPAVDCGGLTTAAAIEGLLGTSADASPQPADLLTDPVASGSSAALAAGGAWCGWGDAPSTGKAPAHSRGVEVTIVPGAADAWKSLSEKHPDAATPGADYDGGVSLGGDCTAPTKSSPGNECHTNVLVGKTWLAVSAFASDRKVVEKTFHEFVQAMLPAAAKFDATAAVPSTAKALPCGDATWLAELKSDIDVSAVSTQADAETFGIQDALLLNHGVTACTYTSGSDGTGSFVGTLSILPSASAVYEDYRSRVIANDSDAHAGSIDVGGQETPTLIRSITAGGSADRTVVDALTGGTWIQFLAQTGDEDAVSAYVQWAAGRL